jgi:hypothetical protein
LGFGIGIIIEHHKLKIEFGNWRENLEKSLIWSNLSKRNLKFKNVSEVNSQVKSQLKA